jgi:RNA polymerase sigma-70 factor (ECF subfamily)
MQLLRPDSDETERLLEQAECGNARVFNDLFSRHREYLLLVVATRLDSRLRRRHDPEDVVQEAQLAAFKRFDDFLERRPMPFRLWLRMTAIEQMLTIKRRELDAEMRNADREVELPDNSAFVMVQQLFAAGSSPSNRLEQSESAQIIREALGKLSENDRDILIMRTLEGLSNQETAEVLQIEPVAASQRYGRALLRLHNLLQKNGLLEPR